VGWERGVGSERMARVGLTPAPGISSQLALLGDLGQSPFMEISMNYNLKHNPKY
jgi:hypothetical protein